MKKVISIILIISILLLVSCGNSTEPIKRNGFLMGTVVTITVYGGTEEDMDNLFSEIQRLESLLSRTLEGSDVYNVNQAAGAGEVEITPETMTVIAEGIRYNEISNGYFDITIGPLVELWGIGTESAAVPEESDLKGTLSKVNMDNFDFCCNTAELLEEGMAIDLGGIAKGFVADEIARMLKTQSVAGAIINLGGNVLTVGQKPDGSNWKVGVQDPFQATGNYMEVVNVGEMSVVTSGPYERNFEEDGVVYHHILNPFTGYPVDNNIASVTIISEKSIDGDGLSTSVFAMGVEEGMELVESLDDTECYIVLSDGSIVMSSGFSNFL